MLDLKICIFAPQMEARNLRALLPCINVFLTLTFKEIGILLISMTIETCVLTRNAFLKRIP